MQLRLNTTIKDLTNPQDLQKLISALASLADELDTLVTETEPNGNISARQGRIALWNDGGTYTTWINTTGSNVWQQISTEP